MRRSNVKSCIAFVIGLTFLFLQPVRIAHGCAFQDIATVHFNTQQPDFGTPVRKTRNGFWDSGLWNAGAIGNEGRVENRDPNRSYAASDSARLPNEYSDYELTEKRKAQLNSLYATLEKQIQAARWKDARQTCLDIVHLKGRWSGDLRDRFDLLTLVLARKRRGAEETSVFQLYFNAVEHARNANWPAALEKLRQVSASPEGELLRDRVRYKEACIAYSQGNAAALNLFARFVQDFPHSPIREDALIMVARICILKDKPDEKMMNQGLSAIRQFLTFYPNSRFYNSAFGLRARVHFLRREYNDALWCYYRLGDLESVQIVCNAMPGAISGAASVRLLEAYLERVNEVHKGDTDTAVLAVRQVNHIRNQLSLNTIRLFQQDLKNSPSLLVSYIYYRLYYTNTRIQDCANLADLARSALKRNSQVNVNPILSVRLAEVEYQQLHFPQSVDWASRALKSRPRCDRALFIRASAESKMNRLAAAQADLELALELSTQPAIRLGVRQLLALVCEHRHNFSEALDQYYALGYDLDAAYLLDVRMNARQIEAFMRSHKNVSLSTTIVGYHYGPAKPGTIRYKRSQLFDYTIGIHLLRQEKWVEASYWLRKVPTTIRRAFDTGRREFGSTPSPDSLPAVNDLARLQRAARKAKGYEARADAAYRYASYYHNHGALLLYNPMLWDGARVAVFEEGWNTRCQTQADITDLRSYFAEHEVNLRSRALCLAVVKKYPRSKVAPQALYRAACASERAGALAGWYEGQSKGFHYTPKGESSALMHRLLNQYPRSPLVPNARKYADVFASESRPADWPHYAALGRKNQPIRNSRNLPDSSEVAAAEELLADK